MYMNTETCHGCGHSVYDHTSTMGGLSGHFRFIAKFPIADAAVLSVSDISDGVFAGCS
jgi:hypothetical protein